MLNQAHVSMNPEPETLHFTRVNNDVNGNPRYVLHFLELLTREQVESDNWALGAKYPFAVKQTKVIGGRKFHNKQFGGGIVFQCYSLPDLTKEIAQLTGRNYTTYEVSR